MAKQAGIRAVIRPEDQSRVAARNLYLVGCSLKEKTVHDWGHMAGSAPAPGRCGGMLCVRGKPFPNCLVALQADFIGL